MRPAFALLLLLALLAGCALPTGTPEERAHRALVALGADLGPAATNISAIRGDISANGYSVPFAYDFARDGTRHFNLTYGPVAWDIYCRDDRVVRIVSGVPTEDRPGSCPLDGGRFASPLALLAQLDVSSARGTGNDVLATFNGTNASAGNMTARIDVHDHVTHLDLASPGGNLSANISYGRRADFHLPVATARIAFATRNYTYFHDGNLTWEAQDATGNASLADIEVRVFNGTTHALVATFHPAQGAASEAGFNFTFADRDGDGRFSRRDELWLVSHGWQREGDYQVQVWDAWANAPVVRAKGVPGPELPLIAVAIGLAGLVATARRRV